jgi:hypothetical protein
MMQRLWRWIVPDFKIVFDWGDASYGDQCPDCVKANVTTVPCPFEWHF